MLDVLKSKHDSCFKSSNISAQDRTNIKDLLPTTEENMLKKRKTPHPRTFHRNTLFWRWDVRHTKNDEGKLVPKTEAERPGFANISPAKEEKYGFWLSNYFDAEFMKRTDFACAGSVVTAAVKCTWREI